MANKGMNLLFVGFGEGNKFTDNILRLYGKQENFKHAFVSHQEDAVEYLRGWDNAIVLMQIKDKVTLSEGLSLLKLAKRGVRDNLFKFAAFNEIAKPNIEPVLQKFGCNDILEKNIRPKTLKFKLDFWSKTLKSRNADSDDDTTTVKGGSKNDEGAYQMGGQVKMVDPLDVEADCWLLRDKSDCKKILRRWLVKLIGPGPAAGHWSEVENKNDPKNSYWKWYFHKKWKEFEGEEGFWFFAGNKPEFDWDERKWQFSGNNASLVFKTGDDYHYRFKLEGKRLEVAENSDFAKFKQDLIDESLAEEVEIEGDNDTIDDDEHNIKEDRDLGGNLKGDVKNEDEEDEVERGDAEDLYGDKGKKKKREIDVDDDLDEEESDGSPKEIDVDHTDEDDEGNRSKFEEGDLGGNLEGKTKGDKKKGIDLDGTFEGEEEEEGESKKSKFKEGDLGGNYDGKTKGKEEISPELAGMFEGETQEDREAKKSNFKEDDLGGNYDGKTKGEEGESGPLKGELEGSEEEEKEGKKSNFKEGDLGGHYDGETEGEKAAEDISGLFNDKEEEASEGKKSEFEEDDLGGHYKGDVEETQEGVEEKEVFGKKKTFFREDDPEREAQERREETKRKQKLAEQEAKDAELDAIEESMGKDRGNKTKNLSMGDRADKEVDLDQFKKDVEVEEAETKEAVDEPSRMKTGDLSAGDMFKNLDKKIEQEMKDGSLDEEVEHETFVNEDGEEVSLESGEIRAVLIRGSDEAGTHHMCNFEDLIEDELVIRAPIDLVKDNDEVFVYLSFKYDKNTASIKLEGEVEEVMDFEEDTEFVTVKVKDVDQEVFDNFMNLYQKRQDNINKFMNTAKGVA
jgi:hypothetical protein